MSDKPMSTCNFAQPTLSKIYSIGVHTTDQDDFDDQYQNVIDSLRMIDNIETCDKWIVCRDTHAVARYGIELYNKDYEQWDYAYIYVIYRDGYYEGGQFDVDLSDFDEFTINKTTQKKIDSVLKKIEKVLKQTTRPCIRTAVFSNGEGIYQFI